MPGRYSLTDPKAALELLFGITECPVARPLYNIAPSWNVPVVRRAAAGGLEAAMMRWGLLPPWARKISEGAKLHNARCETLAEKRAFRGPFAKRRCLLPLDGFFVWHEHERHKSPYRIALKGGRPFACAGLWERWGVVPLWAKDVRIGAKMINARAETVAELPAFREAFAARRCLVPADGFYEWKKDGKARRPFRIGLRDWGPFAFAGLWEHWHPAEGEVVRSFTIIVTDANAAIRPIHNRMPVILDLGVLLRPCPAERLALYEVSDRVNRHANDDAACIEPLRTLFDHGLSTPPDDR